MSHPPSTPRPPFPTHTFPSGPAARSFTCSTRASRSSPTILLCNASQEGFSLSVESKCGCKSLTVGLTRRHPERRIHPLGWRAQPTSPPPPPLPIVAGEKYLRSDRCVTRFSGSVCLPHLKCEDLKQRFVHFYLIECGCARGQYGFIYPAIPHRSRLASSPSLHTLFLASSRSNVLMPRCINPHQQDVAGLSTTSNTLCRTSW